MNAGELELDDGALCTSIPPLHGFTVGITADRRRTEQAHLLEQLGARVVHGPTMHVGNIDDLERLRAVTESLTASPPHYLVATTAIGLRAWFTAAESWGLGDALDAALHASRIVTRGPKSRGAALQAGLDVWWDEPSERLDSAVAHIAPLVAGTTVAVQLDGRDRTDALERLVAAGARVVPVPVYAWTIPADSAPALRLIDAVATRRVDAITFTSAPAVEHFFALARAADLEASVAAALNTSVVAACVGPMTRAAIEMSGVYRACAPAVGRLGLMVRELEQRLQAGHRHLVTPEGAELVLQGDSIHTPATTITLPPRDRAVLVALARRAGAVVAKPPGDAVDAAVSRLRRSLAGTGLEIVNVVRRGHRLVATEMACPRRINPNVGYEQVSGGVHG